ncbi:Erj5 protein [Saccharomycopsis crataegensis]|uniref:Erj5 protein n=1 Tax=Saccharomycopsis crataegensis TaxID=43959 RepID=A0AAV5QFG6_9ASCO|nr:Erj5 protein [Saccharomycopsis crataegensis]
MRINIALFFGCLVTFAIAWSNVDQELFQINYEVKKDLGEDVTFYSWLELPNGPKSSYDEINKAYRKLSRKIHPDKVKRSKFGADAKKYKRVKKRSTERYQRLSIVGEILRSSKKDRYDFFYDHGFPTYKNNTWLYQKFRPSVVMVFVGLYFLIGVFHYVLSKLQNTQNRKRLELTVDQIKRQAWPTGIPPSDGRDRMMTNEATGKTFVVKIDGSVHVVDNLDSSVLHSVNPQDIRDPEVCDNFVVKCPIWIWNSTVGKVVPGLYYTVKPRVNKATKEEKVEEVSSSKKPKKAKKQVGEKKTLPNGTVVGSRKKRN